MNIRARRKHLARKFTKRTGQLCRWSSGFLIMGPKAIDVRFKGGQAVQLTKFGKGCGATA